MAMRHVAWRKNEMSGIICRKGIFERKPHIVPDEIVVKCELRDVIATFESHLLSSHYPTKEQAVDAFFSAPELSLK
jgi:hypothetical protein